MDKQEFIQSCLDKISVNMKKTFGSRLSKSVALLMRPHLDNLIDLNLTYLLTDSFLYFISCYTSYPYLTLERLYESDEYRNSYLVSYFQQLFEFAGCDIDDAIRPFDFDPIYSSIDEDMKKALKYAVKKYRTLDIEEWYKGYTLYDINYALSLVFTYYITNKRQDNIYELCDMILDNPYELLDELYMNKIKEYDSDYNDWDDYVRMLNYIFNKINNKKKKEIK